MTLTTFNHRFPIKHLQTTQNKSLDKIEKNIIRQKRKRLTKKTTQKIAERTHKLKTIKTKQSKRRLMQTDLYSNLDKKKHNKNKTCKQKTSRQRNANTNMTKAQLREKKKERFYFTF